MVGSCPTRITCQNTLPVIAHERFPGRFRTRRRTPLPRLREHARLALRCRARANTLTTMRASSRGCALRWRARCAPVFAPSRGGARASAQGGRGVREIARAARAALSRVAARANGERPREPISKRSTATHRPRSPHRTLHRRALALVVGRRNALELVALDRARIGRRSPARRRSFTPEAMSRTGRVRLALPRLQQERDAALVQHAHVRQRREGAAFPARQREARWPRGRQRETRCLTFLTHRNAFFCDNPDQLAVGDLRMEILA